jgi:hypothetical protein
MKERVENDIILKWLAILYGVVFILTGILGIIILFSIQDIPIIIDPIKQMILILIGIIFIRGYYDLGTKKSSGEAFVFVGTIIGIILGTLALLEFVFVGLIGGLLMENINFPARIFSYLFNPTLILGFLTLIPHKLIKHREM